MQVGCLFLSCGETPVHLNFRRDVAWHFMADGPSPLASLGFIDDPSASAFVC